MCIWRISWFVRCDWTTITLSSLSHFSIPHSSPLSTGYTTMSSHAWTLCATVVMTWDSDSLSHIIDTPLAAVFCMIHHSAPLNQHINSVPPPITIHDHIHCLNSHHMMISIVMHSWCMMYICYITPRTVHHCRLAGKANSCWCDEVW